MILETIKRIKNRKIEFKTKYRNIFDDKRYFVIDYKNNKEKIFIEDFFGLKVLDYNYIMQESHGIISNTELQKIIKTNKLSDTTVGVSKFPNTHGFAKIYIDHNSIYIEDTQEYLTKIKIKRTLTKEVSVKLYKKSYGKREKCYEKFCPLLEMFNYVEGVYNQVVHGIKDYSDIFHIQIGDYDDNSYVKKCKKYFTY